MIRGCPVCRGGRLVPGHGIGDVSWRIGDGEKVVFRAWD